MQCRLTVGECQEVCSSKRAQSYQLVNCLSRLFHDFPEGFFQSAVLQPSFRL